MVLEKGAAWGERRHPPEGIPSAEADLAASRLFAGAVAVGEQPPPILLLGGDLFRALGGREGRPAASRFRVDVGHASFESGEAYFVSHLVARLRWWRKRQTAVMNSEYLGDWQVAPRAHPGDALLDVCDARLDLRQRILALRRLRTGDHVPHPEISVSRVREVDLRFSTPTGIWIDGRQLSRSEWCSVRVLPGALEVYV